MRVLIAGCGSIGARRAKILAAMGHELLLYDSRPEPARELAKELGGKHALRPTERADLALVCTPPETHAVVVESLDLDVLAGLYVEKPLGMTYRQLSRLREAAARVPVTMAACNLRFALKGRFEPMPRPSETWDAYMGQAAHYWSPTHKPVSMVLDSIHELDLLGAVAGRITSMAGWSTLTEAEVYTQHEGGAVGRARLNRTEDPPERWIKRDAPGMYWKQDLWPPDPEMYEREMQHLCVRVLAGEQTVNPIAEAADLTEQAIRIAERKPGGMPEP